MGQRFGAKAEGKLRGRRHTFNRPGGKTKPKIRLKPEMTILDKVVYTSSVCGLMSTQWILMGHTGHFPVYYFVLMSVLLCMRFLYYHLMKKHFYMLDFCYMVNLSCILQTLVFDHNMSLFKTNYVLTHGPILCATIVWRNWIVFQSIDKMTSFALHFLPSLICHITRWNLLPSGLDFVSHSKLTLYDIFVPTTAFYLAWQIYYLLLTEVVMVSQLKSDSRLVTSITYLVSQRWHPVHKFIAKIFQTFGSLPSADYKLDPTVWPVKGMYLALQLAYSVSLFCVSPLCWNSYTFSCVYLITCFFICVWNSTSHKVEVLSKEALQHGMM